MSTRLDFATMSLMDALDLAVLIEREAFERYQMFAAQLGHRHAGDAASVFAGMAKNEAAHGRELAAKRKELFGERPPRVSRDDVFDVEAPGEGAIRSNMSALRAYELALQSEQKALEFYVLALPYVKNPRIVELFAELRDEEVEHVRMVREAIAALPEEAGYDWDEDDDELPAL